MSQRTISRLVVPRSGQNTWLVSVGAAAMCFLAVFAMALSVSAARLAQGWGEALAQTATVRITAPAGEIEGQTLIVLEVLRTTPGIAEAVLLAPSAQAELLEAWLGPDLPLDTLALPRLIELRETPEGPDREGLRLRLQAEAPGAVYDDHTRWRAPLIEAATALRGVALVSLVLIGGVMAAMITLAASAAMASNRQVISVLRLVGARDRFIARAFVRQISLRTGLGALLGTAIAVGTLLSLPGAGEGMHLLAGLGFQGSGWFLPLALPVIALILAYAASLATARRVLKGVT